MLANRMIQITGLYPDIRETKLQVGQICYFARYFSPDFSTFSRFFDQRYPPMRAPLKSSADVPEILKSLDERNFGPRED
jgi:hypothetical protein